MALCFVGLNFTPLFAQNTGCDNLSVPYAQDFEGVANYALPDCWGQIHPFEEGGYPVAAPASPHGGSRSLMFRTYNMPQFALMPLFTNSLNTLQLTFWTRRHTSTSGTFSVGYITDTTMEASFVPLWSSTGSQMGNSSYQQVTVSFENVNVNPALDYYIAFRYMSANAYAFWYVDDITVTAIPSCSAPYGLTSSAITSTSALLTWNGNANSYIIYYKAATDTAWNETPYMSYDSAGYLLEGLNPATTYQWIVAAACEDTLIQSANTASFTTECGVYPAPFSEDFNAAGSLPICWSLRNGRASDAFAGSLPAIQNGGWNFYTGQVFGNYHPRLNVWGSSVNRWIVTPPIDLTTMESPGLTFDLAVTGASSTSGITPGNQPNIRFMVLVSTDMGASWSASNATIWSNDGNGNFVYDSISATGQSVTLQLNQYVNDTVMIAFYGESTLGGGDNDIHIDNVLVEEFSTCPKPIQLTSVGMTSTSVTLDWTETSDATTWNIHYGLSGFDPDGVGATPLVAHEHPFTVTGLPTGESYDFYVQADCGDALSTWLGPVTVQPGYWNMRITGTDTVTLCAGMIYDNGGPGNNYSTACNNTLIIYPEMPGASVSLQGEVNTEPNYDSLCIYDGAGLDGTLLGVYSGLNLTVPTLVSSSGPLTLHFKSDYVTQYAGFALEVNCVTCFPPSGLAVSDIAENTAMVSWNGNGYAQSWLVEYKADGDTSWIQETASDTFLLLSNLEEATFYEVHVRTDCNDEFSMPSVLTFATGQTPSQLPYSTSFGVSDDRVWLLNNGPCSNRWTVGVSGSDDALFVTANGSTPGYTVNGAVSNITAEKVFLVGAAEEIAVSFDVNVGGEANYDYMKAFFAPADFDYLAGDNFPEYALASYDSFAVNFSAYTSQSAMPYILQLTGNTAHVEVTMPNPNAAPTDSSTAKLVFVWRNDNSQGTQPGAVIYNVEVDVVTCPQPENLTVTNVAAQGVTLSWSSPASLWNIEYREAGTAGWQTATSTDTFLLLTGLTSGTSYEVRVQSECGSNVSLWAVGNFTTDCEAVTSLPYTQGFETMNQMPDCWRQEIVSGNESWTTHAGAGTSSSDAHGGLLNAFLSHSGYDNNVTRLISPVFDLSGLANPYLSFWLLQPAWNNDQDELTVYYRTAPDAAWQMLVQHSASVEDWMLDSIALPNPTSTCQICFEGLVHYGYGIAIDDITIADAIIPVINPTVVTGAADPVTQISATLHATITNPDNVSVSAKGFEWKAAADSAYTQIAGTGAGNAFTADLTNLTPNTNYTFKAFITFNGTTVEGIELTFTTQPDDTPDPCDVPTGLHTTDIQNESVSIAWDANPNVNSWNVRYRLANGSWNSGTSPTNSHTITGLTGDKDYEIQVQAICADGTSDWSASITAHTTNVGIENWLSNSVNLFPNPAKEVVNIQCTMNNVQLGGELQLFDVYGKLLQIVPIISETTQIDVSGLADGMYFVRVTTESGVVTKTFVKK